MTSNSPHSLSPTHHSKTVEEHAQGTTTTEGGGALQTEATIEIRNEQNESDDGYATDSDLNASTSLASSAYNIPFENGRRFHKYHEGIYLFPNDEQEQEREDMKHSMIVNLCGGKLHYAPFENLQMILDIGTGTGVWAIDTTAFRCSGPIQPLWVPPNVRFMVDVAGCAWLHPDNHFDFVHLRHLTSSIKDFPKLFKAAYDKLKPGGWIEIQDLYFQPQCDDDSLPAEYTLAKSLQLMEEGLARFNVDLLSPTKHPGYIRDAGFTNINERNF
ncbi:hypothetical protein PAAG_06707 [Paracoccidioides lutzii Pb01]|uniref:Uncharacterized protein n=1 Tax=Paracoccidioides lutzii (strain ATCC MYA-826 / Pb01) TaxID=502779 RepID=C1H7G6_PARBA|nr:hypothetical protein PAAG_06707 [Paracoccidioides lutzii Pb01]EEH35660.2 hypothetical protein PAAG_06707 [Paracoccidioides lutzii Pb01]